jgi:ArsR family transcriptional regulator
MRTPRPCCPPLLLPHFRRADADEIAASFKALADPARLRILNFIAGQASGEACVCHFTELVGLSQPTVSHHLKILYDAGLLERERRGTWVYYRIVADRLEALRQALAAPSRRLHARPRE